MLAPMQWVGTLEPLCSWVATTDAPTTTAAAAQQCVGISGILCAWQEMAGGSTEFVGTKHGSDDFLNKPARNQ